MPKNYGRNERVAALMLQETARILQHELKDPRVRSATVTEVSVSPDLRNAKIYVSSLLDDDKAAADLMAGLQSASGFIRSTLASRLKLRYMPALTFEYDSLQTEAMKLDALIARGLGDGSQAEEPGDDESEADQEAAAAQPERPEA